MLASMRTGTEVSVHFQVGGCLPNGLALKKTSGQHANYTSGLRRTCAVVMGRSHPVLVASSESQNQVPGHLTISSVRSVYKQCIFLQSVSHYHLHFLQHVSDI